MGEGMCSNCPSRLKCQELCPEALTYINQNIKTSEYYRYDEIYEPRDYAATPIARQLTWLEWASLQAPHSLRELFADRKLHLGEWRWLTKRIHFAPSQKRYIYAHYWLGWSLPRMANYWGISFQAIHQSLNRGLRKIQNTLRAEVEMRG